MKTERNILVAFLLNFFFAVVELFGGIFTNSVAIISDSVHDLGDSISIGISFFLEKKSKRKPDNKYTYGYARFSILGAFITTTILIVGSVIVIISAVNRIMHPVEIDYNGMILFAIFGVIVNFFAALATREGDSLNQKAVNLHMLEDVLGWVIVLIGSILMKYTDISIIDPIMSIAVALFILIHATKEFKEILDLFLIKLPNDIDIDEIREHLLEIEGIKDVHHIHIWSTDGEENYATMHVKASTKDLHTLKENIRNELAEHNIEHTTLELEEEDEECEHEACEVKGHKNPGHHHHHH